MPKFYVNVRLEATGTELVEAESAEEAEQAVYDEGIFSWCSRRDNDADGCVEYRVEVTPTDEEEDD